VDYITIFDEITPLKILSKIKPHIYCNGPDWGENCIEKEVVEKHGGKIYILKWSKGLSTTKIIKKISDVYSKPQKKAVFLDRDGTININEPEYIHKIEDFKFVPYVIPALQKLSKTDYKIIIVTNQSGIGKEYFKKQDLEKLHRWMIGELKKKNIRIDKIYYCPHQAKDNCSCRKPKGGMLFQAVKDFGLDLSKSWIIGDSERDVITGRRTNVKTILLGNVGKAKFSKLKISPHYWAKNFLDVVNIILKNS
jgi:D-glycero-D-manno-heptose 1,7-bisphosphate phosphatase